jgi:hypothetical protein
MKTTSITMLVALAGCAALAHAQPLTPVYQYTFNDAVTGDNNFQFGGFRYYTVDGGADSYQNDIYERPIAQGFNLIGTNYASEEYHSYTDIVQARLGWDSQYLYVSMDLWGDDIRTKDGVNAIVGMKAKYLLRIGNDADGRNSFYFLADEPGFAAFPNTIFTNAKTEGFRDTDADVGGRGGPIHGQPGPSGVSVTRTQNPIEEFGMNGYDQQIIQSDGIFNGGQGQIVMWQRVSPLDPTVIEIAIDYVTLGLTQVDLANLRFVDFAAVAGGPAGPENGLWNDKFFAIDAGSPNRGIGTDNEFGTQGLGAIYLADNVRGTIAPIGPTCDSIDFNNDGSAFDPVDIDAFLSVFSEGPCIPTGATCNDIDFNNDGALFDPCDVASFLLQFSEGPCTSCGQ